MQPNSQIKTVCLFVTIATIFYLLKPKSYEVTTTPKFQQIENISTYITRMNRRIPRKFCKFDFLAIIIIHSQPQNFQKRKIIRKTWKNNARSAFFLIGKSTNSKIQRAIMAESDTFTDTILADFIDTDANRTLKSFLMLDIIRKCHLTYFILKTEDSNFINPINTEIMIQKLHLQEYDLLQGHISCGLKPSRNPKSDWFVPHDVYPEDEYPKFLAGGSYLMGYKAIDKLYEAALTTPLVPREDVFVTGICAHKAGLDLEHSSLFDNKKKFEKTCSLNRAMAIFDLTREEIGNYYVLLDHRAPLDACVQLTKFSSFDWIYNFVFGLDKRLFSFKSCY